MSLSFDPVAHQYAWNGQPVPGVTSLLQHLHSFSMVDPEVLAEAQDRGKYVHDCCHAWDENDLDESFVKPEMAGYVESWKRFTARHEPNWTSIEQSGYSKIYHFAGTEDRFGTMLFFDGNQGARCPVDLDIKTSAQSHRVWGLQLAAYRQLRIEESIGAALNRRVTVRLKADGSFPVVDEWINPNDWPAFLALISLHRWSINK